MRHISRLERDLNFAKPHGRVEIFAEFDTAWNQPTEWIQAVFTHFPTLNIVATYFEPGCLLCGQYFSNSSKPFGMENQIFGWPEDAEEIVTVLESFGYDKEDFDLNLREDNEAE